MDELSSMAASAIVGRAFMAAVLALGTTGCGSTVTEEECRQLLDHYTDKQIDQARPSTNKRGRIELRMEAQKKASVDPEFQRCSAAVSRRQFECAMAAASADQIERCLL